MGSRSGVRILFEHAHDLFPCFVLLPLGAIGGADRALHVEGNGGTLDVSPDDNGCWKDHRGGADFGTAAC